MALRRRVPVFAAVCAGVLIVAGCGSSGTVAGGDSKAAAKGSSGGSGGSLGTAAVADAKVVTQVCGG